VSSHGGHGLKKAVTRWYAALSDMQLLRMVTRYRSSHLWTNKDMFKLYHLKPHTDGVNVIFKYVLFGYKKVKAMNSAPELKEVMDFIHDLETVSSSA
jgi:hypothetical protein